MADFSFDITSKVDLQEIDNAVNQARKELANRYDFKGAKFSIDYNREEKKITLVAGDDFKLRGIHDSLGMRLSKRGISLKSIKYKEPEKAFEGNLRQIVEITDGIPKDRARELVQIIKDLKLKVQARIEEDKIRVTSAKKDDLQAVMTHLRDIDFPVFLQFGNYR
ncbi:MAG: YajQ family cyclic di-GMP-binding protein [Candidatus Omnitrophica bacterium CG12_big_fil_rev_8_21_14_0_65_42_8]|nr:MAG: YajQ family cyclic di-GMP-binding protein [Candidatus Omnitrophica bacterium CG12_big_fil_rev_8_21_14_0_65_42_8]